MIRPAVDADGPAIGKLYVECEINDLGVDWSVAHVRGSWIIAEGEAGGIVGAAQVLAQQPYGYLEQVIVHPGARGQYGRVVRSLITAATVLCDRLGVQIILTTIGEPRLRRGLVRHCAWTQVTDFGLMARRLRDA